MERFLVTWPVFVVCACAGPGPTSETPPETISEECGPGEFPPAEASSVSCEGADVVLPALAQCTPASTRVVDVVVANAAFFSTLTAEAATRLYSGCIRAQSRP
jgi:hypothetical protein